MVQNFTSGSRRHVDQVVVSILDTANSSYLAPFNVLSQRIKEGSVEANNNLKFLESITTPCQNVSTATRG